MNKILVLALLVCYSVVGQDLISNQKLWSETNKLKAEDFKLKLENQSSDVIGSQFLISYEAKGFDFLKRNLNQRVKNIFISNSSWIDSSKTDDINLHIEFHQLQFDLSEIYTRKFRKRLLINKKKISKGFDEVNKIHNEISEEFTKERMLFINETKSGRNKTQLDEWKLKIKEQLLSLHEFRFENTKKIKLKK
ncbi:hypothetical protein [Tenacibaculum sp. IB213877]|uniref:hypothetical protein n=1 Tax=Tenacibaculum sp. IB213877 TaxID=3097351 RepID=UPI002A5ADA37|nr:hypothetical protein [Tenacibaculum sp. IB213877]MDY0780020.1 hypothetical protein [Tenacibaculum sp. IB213877]